MRQRFDGKILLIRRRYLVALGITAVVIGIFYIINHPALVGHGGRERVLPIYSVQREDSALSLTFNAAAPTDAHTAQVMEILSVHGVRATFFVTGEWARENGELAAALRAGGHELMNLSDDHGMLRRLGVSDIQVNLSACNEAIWAVTGVQPSLFRVPYGAYDDQVVSAAAGMGMRTIQWSIDSGDWRGYDANAIVRRVTGRAFSGGIVLLHSNLEETVLALPDLIQGLMRAGYVLVPVSEMVIQSEYMISPTGRQVPVSGG